MLEIFMETSAMPHILMLARTDNYVKSHRVTQACSVNSV
jgi:hypothetical protein